MKKVFILASFMGLVSLNAQVGINTTTPNGASVLDITSNNKGILIPRLSDNERNTTLADNDILTVPPTGVVNSSLAKGTLIYNTTADRFEFWDGVLWRQLFVATSSAAGNDGVVKINSGAGNSKPTIALTSSGNSYGAEKLITYTTPLVFAASPTTSWPETTVPFPGQTSNIYITTGSTSAQYPSPQRWIENLINGQVHIWRLIATVTPGSNNSGSVKTIFRNPDSGFEVNSIVNLPSGSSGSGKVLTFYFYTIADPESTAPNKGYQLSAQTDTDCNFVVESFTRISLFKD